MIHRTQYAKITSEAFSMQIYDGANDKKAKITSHTVTVVSANQIKCSSTDMMTIRKNGRTDWSLFYCENGCLYFEDKILKAGQIWIYPPKVPQKYKMFSDDKTVYRYLHFTGSDVFGLLDSLNICLSTTIDVKKQSLSNIFDLIQDSLSDDSGISVLRAEYHTLRLISKIATAKPATSEIHMMKRVTDNMEHSFASEYNATLYADMLGISVSRFNHLFKECIGVSPYAYFVRLRIINACNLLEDTNLKIKEIADRCGYKDPLYFTQAFKKETGKTPSDYRK